MANYTTHEQIQNKLVNGIFVPAKELRIVLDVENIVTQKLSKFPEEFQHRYNALVAVAEKYSEEFGENSTKTIDLAEEVGLGLEGKIQLNTINRFRNGNSNFRQTKYLVNKLFPEIKKSYELGHQNISVLRANMALALAGMDASDPRRQPLRALYLLLDDLDKMLDDKELKNVNIDYLTKQLELSVSRKRNIESEINRDIDILKGKAESTLILEYEPIGLNQAKGRVASFIGTVFKDVITSEEVRILEFLKGIDYQDLQGSPTLTEDILTSLVDVIDPKRKARKIKRSSTKRGSIAGATQRRTRKPRLREPNFTAAPKSAASIPLMAMVGIFNEQLPQVISRNMHAPRLNLRTGRLAESVRVTDAVTTPKGFPSFGYTYMKSPYQTFEPGFKQGDPDRDPRKLIDVSMREIAAEYAIGRFFTRRN